MREVIESDWKYFRKHLESWRERYISKVNKKLEKILSDEKLFETEKFWKLKETCDKNVLALRVSYLSAIYTENFTRSSNELSLYKSSPDFICLCNVS